MAEKTIALTGAEVKIEYGGGCNAWLRNDGTATVYAAKAAGITAGADGVVAVPAGGSAPLYGADGTVFLLGTGSVQLIGSDYSTNPFKTSTASGGSGVDDVARAAVEAHAGNAEVHVTAAEKAVWNGKADVDDCVPATMGLNFSAGAKEYAETYKSGAINIEFTWRGFGATDAPYPGGDWFFHAYKGEDNWIRIVAFDIRDTASYEIAKRNGSWGSWKKLADGGNAASVGAYTEEKIAALEARIAALEGGGT